MIVGNDIIQICSNTINIFSCIECTAVESKTEMFCLEIANYLHILAEFNRNIYKRRNAYPYSEELMDLLRIYVELEYETLYGNVSFPHSTAQLQKPWEEKVVKRVLDVLYMMLPCCYDYFDDFHGGMQPFNVELSRDMHVFQVLKSAKLRYQKNPGFIKKAMMKIIHSNGEMNAIIRGSLKNSHDNSLTKVWTDKSLSFLTDQQLPLSLTRTIPESADDCFKYYQLDITDLNINYESSNELNELTGMEFEETESINEDDKDNITAYDIDRNAGNLVLNARKFIQPPPPPLSVSQQYTDSQNFVKQESSDNNDKDNDSHSRDKDDLEPRDANNVSNDNGNASIEKPANGKQKRSTHNERIVGHIIVTDDEDEIDNGDIVCISDDDDDDDVELVTETTVNAPDTQLKYEEHTGSTPSNVVEEEPDIVNSLLAVLAAQAVEKEKLRVDTTMIITPEQVEQTGKDAQPSIEPEDLSKKQNKTSTLEIQKDSSIADEIIDAQTTSNVVEPTLMINKEGSTIDPNIDKVVPDCDPEVPNTLIQSSKVEHCSEMTDGPDVIDTTLDSQNDSSVDGDGISPLEKSCTEITTESESNLDAPSTYQEPSAMESIFIVDEEKKQPIDEEKQNPLSTLDEEKDNSISTPDEEMKNTVSTVITESESTLMNREMLQNNDSEPIGDVEPTTVSVSESLDKEGDSKNTASTDSDVNAETEPILPVLSTESVETPITDVEYEVTTTTVVDNEEIVAKTRTAEHEPEIAECDLNIAAIVTVQQQIDETVLYHQNSEFPCQAVKVECQFEECTSKVESSRTVPAQQRIVNDRDIQLLTNTDFVEETVTTSYDRSSEFPRQTVEVDRQFEKSKVKSARIMPEGQTIVNDEDIDLLTNALHTDFVEETVTTSYDRSSDFPCQAVEVERQFEKSKVKMPEGPSIVNDREIELLTNAPHADSIQETIEIPITSTDSILTTSITTTETLLTLEEAEEEPLNMDIKTNLALKQLGNQLPAQIPDVQTGSNLPRPRSTESVRNECQIKAISIRKLSGQDEVSKLSLPQLKRIVRPAETSITKTNDNIHSVATKSPEKNTSRRSETKSYKDHATKSTTHIDTLCQNMAKSKMDSIKKKESVRTKAARKQGIEPITSSDAQPQNLTSDVPVQPSYNTSGDPLMSSIDLSSLDEVVTMNTSKDYDHSKDDETDKDKDVTNSQNINNDETVGAPVEDYLLPDVLLDMEIQTEPVSSAKETHEVIEIVDHTSNDVDTDPTKDDRNAQGEIQLIEHPRIVHKINNRTLSIDGRMAKSTMCCLESQKETITWDTNDCSAGFCSAELRPQAYKNDSSDNVGLEQEDVEKFLLSGNVRSSLEVLDDIRNMDAQQLFEQGVASEQCDEPAPSDSRNAVFGHTKVNMRVIHPNEMNSINVIKNPVNEFVVQHVLTEHPNIVYDKGQDPFILVNAIAVDSILAITNNKEQSCNRESKEKNNTIESQIKIIEKEVASATVGQFKGAPNMSQRIQDLRQSSIENHRKEEPKVIVENLYDKLKQKPTKSYVQYYTPLPSDPKASKRIQRRTNYNKKRKSTSTSSSTSNSPSQGAASPSLSTSSSSSRNDTKKISVPKYLPTTMSPHSITNSTKPDAKKINITINSHFDQQESSNKKQVNTTSAENSTDATFNRLRNEYLFGTTSGSSAAKSASPPSAKVNVTPKASGINPEETKKQSKRSTTPITTSPYAKFDAQKDVSSESSAEYPQGSKKIYRRGNGSLGSISSASSTTSSQGSSSGQRGHSKKGNVNYVTDKLLQQRASEAQQQRVGSSPADNTDYDELNRLDEIRRRESQNQRKRLQMDIKLNMNNNPNSNSNSHSLQFAPQYMAYPQKSPYYSPSSRQHDGIPSQSTGINPRAGSTPGSTGMQNKQTSNQAMEFRPWVKDNTQQPHLSPHNLAGSSAGRDENMPRHTAKTPGKPKKQNRQIYQNLPNVSQPGTKLPEFW